MQVFCPKQNWANSLWNNPFPISILKLPNQDEKLTCPNRLAGQNVIRAGMFSVEERIINGQVVKGDFGMRVHQYLSKKYKYHPIFHMGTAAYYPQNNSWGGNPLMVNTIINYFNSLNKYSSQCIVYENIRLKMEKHY